MTKWKKHSDGRSGYWELAHNKISINESDFLTSSGKKQWDIEISNPMNSATIRFKSEKSAKKFMKDYMRQLENLLVKKLIK